MPNDRTAVPGFGVSVLTEAAYPIRSMSARLLPAAAAFSRFGPDIAKLSRLVEPSVAMTFSPAWWRAVPSSRGYAHRLLLLHEQGELRAVVSLREKIVFGCPVGVLHGGDARGEALVLCRPGTEPENLVAALAGMSRSHRFVALLLSLQAEHEGWIGAQADLSSRTVPVGALHLQHRTRPQRFRWQTALHPSFQETLAPFGHRTRRNLRHALRRVEQNGWEFLPELRPGQASEATHALAERSTHPYSRDAIAARLVLEQTQTTSFSMGIRSAAGEWLSMVTGVRRPGGVTDIFWQANVASHDSLAIAMRALLMQFEGARGSRVLRFPGGTSPLMEHCCQPESGTETLITRPGMRLGLLRRLVQTAAASPANAVRHLLEA